METASSGRRPSLRRLVCMAVVAGMVWLLCGCCCTAEAVKARRVKKTLPKGRVKGAAGAAGRGQVAEGEVKLVGGRGPAMGTVLIFHDNRWGAVCDNLWELPDAHVVCRQLGFPGAVRSASGSEFGPGKQRMWLSEVQCSGQEKRLVLCPSAEWDFVVGERCAGDKRAAGVVCQKRVRPSSAKPRKGGTTAAATTAIPTSTTAPTASTKPFLQALTLVDSNEDYRSSNGAQTAWTELSPGDAVTVKVLADPSTTTTESTTSRGTAFGGFHVIASEADATVELNTTQSSSTASRPISTTSYLTPTTEPTKASTNATMTVAKTTAIPFTTTTKETTMDNIENTTIQNENGAATITAAPPPTSTAVLMNTTMAVDAGTKLTAKVVDLKKANVKEDITLKSPALSSEDAILLQADSPAHPELELRLVGGRYPSEGRVEVREAGSAADKAWGTICGDSWSLRETMVVCRQMNLHHAKQAGQTNYFGGENVGKKYFSFKCIGREAKIHDCRATLISDDNACKKKTSLAGVVCASYLPDLVPNLQALQESITLQNRPLYYLRCALEENCLSSSAYVIRNTSKAWTNSMRKLLRFSTVVHNSGNADFRPILARGQWEWHQCHQHYHSMEVFSHYDIMTSNGTRLAEGSKASFCLEDTFCDKGIHPRFNCDGYGEQGLSVNCSDSYNWDIDCQWIDVTDIQPGIYTFLVEVNPDFLVAELDFDNNVARCDLWYSGYAVKLMNCRLDSLIDYRRS